MYDPKFPFNFITVISAEDKKQKGSLMLNAQNNVYHKN